MLDECECFELKWFVELRIEDWGLGIGDWGLRIED